jgi:ribonuclease P protein component
MTEAYPPSARVRRRADYRRIQSSRSRVHTRHFLIVIAAAPTGSRESQDAHEPQRLGVTVTKKVGNAVVRNRIKRVVREVFRRNRSLLPAATDIVFIAKRGAGQVGYAEVLAELTGARDALARQRDRLVPQPIAPKGATTEASS